jgi:hypothetical protein
MTTSRKTRKAVPGNRPSGGRPTAKPTKNPCRSAAKKVAERAIQPGTKQATLVALLERPKGATIAQMCAKTRWQAHSVRAALTGLRKRGFGISRAANDAGTTVYNLMPQ